MNNNFTQRAQKALTEAEKIASELGHTYIGTEHILYGLISEGEGVASKLLEGKGASPERVKEIISDYAGVGTKTSLSASDMTPRSKKIIELSAYEASNTYSHYIGTEHLLLALISENDSVGLKILNSMNINVNELRSELIAFFTNSSATKQKSQKKKASASSLNSSEFPTLSLYGRDLTAMARLHKIDPIIARENEISRVIQILSRRTKNNPCLIGEPGVGKTAVVEGLSELITNNKVPETLKNKVIITLDIPSMIAGAKYRGEFEERMKSVLEEVSKNPSVILFIDEIHTIVGAGAAEGAVDAANILKPALARGEIQLIGATTVEEYRKHIEKDSALERRFQSVIIDEPSEESAIKILFGLRDRYESHHNLKISDEAIEAAVRLSKRYIPDRFLPDKAIDLVDEAASKMRISSDEPPKNLKNLEDNIKQIEVDKENAIRLQDFERASVLRDEERRAKEEYEALFSLYTTQKNMGGVVRESDIRDVITEWTKIPVGELEKEESEKLYALEATLKKYIIGQDEAISTVCRAIRRSKTGLKDPYRPSGVFLFLGPTGVGKTELAKVLALSLFGDRGAMVRLDMSEYMEKHTVSRLIGSPPGYVGYGEAGQLSEKIKRRPYSLLLLDEIEKAHPDVLNILLQVMEDGFLTDAQGRKIDFRNTIIIMTSNVGAKELASNGRLGFYDGKDTEAKNENTKRDAKNAMKTAFRPEFINRLDEVVVFNKLTRADVVEIAKIMLSELQKRTKELGIDIELSSAVCELIAEKGNESVYGARELRRTITAEIEDTLAYELISKRIVKGDKVTIEVENGRVVYRKA